MMNGALPTVAALAGDHDVTIIDENVRDIDFDTIERFDIVGVTGMTVQRWRMAEILELLRDLDVLVVVGGPYASVDEDYFDGLCDVLFSGEADTTWPAFLDDLASGRPYAACYRQHEPTDLTTLPPPRVDLVEAQRYVSGAVQFSRGCPFRCEFCDIIVTLGRRPRTKRPEQVLAELDAMRAAGFRHVFLVDDNFVGDRVAARELLREVAAWQEQNGRPLRLSTEASVDLADDEELLQLLRRANFRHVFVGIETPRAETLRAAGKTQNARGDAMGAKIARIRAAGIDVHGGFIVGFDEDDASVFDEQFEFIQRNGIQLAMVGMLTAIPKTALHERLKREGRLVDDDPNCNIVPRRMARDELRRRHLELVRRLADPTNFFERALRGRRPTRHPPRSGRMRRMLYGVAIAWSLLRTLRAHGCLRRVGGVYLRNFLRRERRDASIGFAQFMNRCAEHWHVYRFTHEAERGTLRMYNSG